MFMGGPHRGMAREKERAKDRAGTLRRLLGYLTPYSGLLLAVGALVITGSLIEIAGPYMIQVSVDQFIAPSGSAAPAWLYRIAPAGTSRMSGLMHIMLVLLISYILRWLSMVGQFYIMNVIGQKLLFRMRTQIMERIHQLSLKFFDEHEAGDLMSRLVNDTQVINRVFGGDVVRLLGFALTLSGIVVAMFALSWQLALVSFSILPVMLFTTTTFANRARKAFRKTRETIGDVSAELQENISGVREVQAFSRERENVAEFRQINRRNRDANVQAQTLTSAFGPTFDILSTAALAIVLGYGGWSVLRGVATVGLVVGFMNYVQRFYRPIQMISSMWTQLQSALAGAERIFELLDTPSEIADTPDAVELPEVEGQIAFDHVDFHYKPGEPVLQDITFTIEPGQTFALVGPTGAGKTSTVSLLMRFYDVVGGNISVDGYDIRRVQQASLRRQTGMVLQDTFLFSGSVLENIRYGRLNATDKEVMEAAKLARAHAFIERLPDGYQTDIGERGHNLSQGQRQLLSIARAILANPRILILDEATSSVDTRTELLIQQALGELLHGRSSLVIAHRLSTIRNADQVLVIDQGKIVERGTHTTLMQEQGRYYDLYMSQFRRQEQAGLAEEMPIVATSVAIPEIPSTPADEKGDGHGQVTQTTKPRPAPAD